MNKPVSMKRWLAGGKLFTLIELLVVVSIIVVLLAILMPTLRVMQDMKSAAHCENNMHQLSSSWLSYATDNGGKLVSAFTANYGGTTYTGDCWALNAGGTDEGITNGALWNYVGTVNAYKCPIFPFKGRPAPIGKARNYSMNQYANGGSGWGDFSGLPATRLTEVQDPENTYVFCEEDDTRTDLLGSFIVSNGTTFVDRIGRWHSFGSVFSFADGHAKRWRWMDEKTKKISNYPCGGMVGAVVGTKDNNVDLIRMHKAVSPGNPRNKW